MRGEFLLEVFADSNFDLNTHETSTVKHHVAYQGLWQAVDL